MLNQINMKIKWKETSKSLPDVNQSCLVVRKDNKVCNLYFDGINWLNDGYILKDERIFNDVTHWVLLSDIPLPKQP